MGKNLWRKNSYVKVEDDHQGCVWTVFHMLDNHPWNNVRKKLLCKKHRHRKSTKRNNRENEIRITHELQEDSIMKYSTSVNSNVSNNKSTSKRSIKARIRALIKDKNNSTKSDLQLNVSKFQGQANECNDDHNGAPNLMSLLKANPKLIRSVSRLDESNDIMKHKRETKDSKKEDGFVGVLELFNVDKELFIKILQDTCPTKPKLVKSRTFPSQKDSNFGTTPSKVEHKHNEIWPMSSSVHDLRKVKSQCLIKSSSLKEVPSGKFGYLSRSLRLMNEKEYGLPFKERFDLFENEVNLFNTNEPLSRASLDRLSNTNQGEMRMFRLDSLKGIENLVELESKEKGNWYNFEEERVDQETNDEVYVQEGEIEVKEESQLMTNMNSKRREDSQDSTDHFSMEYYSQDLQYVQYVLDIVSLATLKNQHEGWHSQYHPLNPALFDGIEVCCPFEPKTTNKDAYFSMSESHRKILFDLINEALINIHNKSYSYYPKALSQWCQICPMIKEKNCTIEEVIELVKECFNWRPELDPSLDHAVVSDLSRDNNGWVNLQFDSEGVGLELEDLIFDELLDELVCY